MRARDLILNFKF